MAYDNLIKAGSTSKIIEVLLRNSTTGQGATGILWNWIAASYVREGGTRTAITLANGTAGDSYSSGKWAEIDSTNTPGLYSFHIPNAAIAAGVAGTNLYFVATGVINKSVNIRLVAHDVQDATRLGLSALPNAATGVAGGLLTFGSGIAQINTITGYVYATGINVAAGGGGGITASDVWTYGTRSLTDKGGYALVASGQDAIASGVWAVPTRTLSAFGFNVTVGSNLDKTGYALTLDSGNIISSGVWNVAARTITDKAGYALSQPEYGIIVTGVWNNATRTLSAFGFNVTVDTNNDKTGYSLTQPAYGAIATGVWGAPSRIITGNLDKVGYALNSDSGNLIASGVWNVSSKLITNPEIANLDTTVSSRLASISYTSPDNADIISIKAKTDLLTFINSTVAATLNGSGVIVTTNNDKAGYALSPASGNIISSGTWSVVNKVVTNPELSHLDVDVSSRLAAASYTAPDNASITSIKSVTDQLHFVGSGIVATLNSSGVVVNTNNDKGGYSILASSGAIISSGVLNTIVEGIYSVQDVLRLSAALLVGSRAGGGTNSLTFQGLDGATTRVAFTVDGSGNSTAAPIWNTL